MLARSTKRRAASALWLHCWPTDPLLPQALPALTFFPKAVAAALLLSSGLAAAAAAAAAVCHTVGSCNITGVYGLGGRSPSPLNDQAHTIPQYVFCNVYVRIANAYEQLRTNYIQNKYQKTYNMY